MERPSQAMIEIRIRGLLKIFHIPETDEQVKIVIKLFQKQAKYATVQSKTLSFLERFKANLL